jgi:pyruvate ferredoxin oxidoreductase alpha subunit
MPEIFAEQKMGHVQALNRSMPVILEAWAEIENLTGRKYSPLELCRAEGAETLILAMGSICETASLAVDQMREQGRKVGLAKLKLWRPLPVNEIRKALGAAKDVVVLDRSLSPGAGNAPVTTEIRAVMYNEPQRPRIHCMVAGLGGRDIAPDDVIKIVDTALTASDTECHIYGVRG